jgi:hypothetical protein
LRNLCVLAGRAEFHHGLLETVKEQIAQKRTVGDAMEKRQRGERNIITADALHLLKRKFQKRFLGQQCAELTACLADALAATKKVAPVREGKDYIHDRSAERKTAASEATWEERLFRQCKVPRAGSYAPWKGLLTYQVSLQNHRKNDADWGEIDLLGVSKDNLPVIVELKAPGSNESPAQMLAQATAYAIALQKAWPKCLRTEWAKNINVDESELPNQLSTCEIVCAAPTEYWENWTGDTARAGAVKPGVWAAVADLRKALERKGYPSVFVRLKHQGPASDPTRITLAEEQLPRR